MDEVNFTRRMSHAPDEELLTVVSSDGFVPAAVEAAKAEIARRNISPDELVRTSVRVRELQRVNDSRPSMPLSAWAMWE